MAASALVVLVVRTTGGRSERHRVIEVAAVRIQGGRTVGEYESLVNPGVQIRRFATDYTGVTPELADEAPLAVEVLDELRTFVGDAVLVGHGIGAALVFLNYEAVWHDRAPFGNPTLDTQALALQLAPGIPRPDLDRTAKALGLTVAPHRRALPTARLNARVLGALLARARDAGAATIADLRRLAGGGNSRITGGADEVPTGGSAQRSAGGASLLLRRGTLPDEELRRLPDTPGVYRFLDAAGGVLYVGKAAS